MDFKKLNTAVQREHYMPPNVDDISPKLVGATVFSKLDAASCFHQIPLDAESCKLTTHQWVGFVLTVSRLAFRLAQKYYSAKWLNYWMDARVWR